MTGCRGGGGGPAEGSENLVRVHADGTHESETFEHAVEAGAATRSLGSGRGDGGDGARGDLAYGGERGGGLRALPAVRGDPAATRGSGFDHGESAAHPHDRQGHAVAEDERSRLYRGVRDDPDQRRVGKPRSGDRAAERRPLAYRTDAHAGGVPAGGSAHARGGLLPDREYRHLRGPVGKRLASRSAAGESAHVLSATHRGGRGRADDAGIRVPLARAFGRGSHPADDDHRDRTAGGSDVPGRSGPRGGRPCGAPQRRASKGRSS